VYWGVGVGVGVAIGVCCGRVGLGDCRFVAKAHENEKKNPRKSNIQGAIALLVLRVSPRVILSRFIAPDRRGGTSHHKIESKRSIYCKKNGGPRPPRVFQDCLLVA